VKVRRVYEKTPGERLVESLGVNGHPALEESVPSKVAEAPRSGAFLVHPIPARLNIRGSFFHQEYRTVQESYTVQEPYTAFETYNCGTGTSYQTCSRSVTRYRSETRYRTVTKMVDVSDGTCSQDLLLEPARDRVYLVDFTYRDTGVCAAVCVEQTSIRPDGSFENRPCPTPTEAQIQEMSEK
jgi:hypothetical protein